MLLANIDLAGAIAAHRELQLRGGNPKASFVTVALNRVEFKKPVLVGDVVRFETTIVRIGRTSITVRIDVHAERGAEVIHVTEAEAVLNEIRARLAAIRTVAERASIVRKLVRGITIWTEEVDGKRVPVADIEYLFRRGKAGQTGSHSGSTRASTPSSKSRMLAATTSSSTPECKPGPTPTTPTRTATA